MQTVKVASKIKTKRQTMAIAILAPLETLSLQVSLPCSSFEQTTQLKAAVVVGK
jgi:hypothetical protein